MVAPFETMARQRGDLRVFSEYEAFAATEDENQAVQIGHALANLDIELVKLVDSSSVFAAGLDKSGELAGQQVMLRITARERAKNARENESRAREMTWGCI